MRRRSGILIALFTCTALTWACAGRSPSSAVKAFYKAVTDGNSDEAISLLSRQTVATVGEDKLRAGIQEATRDALAKGGIQELQITGEKSAGDVATVTVVLKYGNGTQENQEVQLVKETGGWRLQPEK